MDPQLQRELIEPDGWIINGELASRPATLEVRRQAADTLIRLDLLLARRACRALRRSRERLDFWLWLSSERTKSLPLVPTATTTHAPTAEQHVLPTPADVERFIDHVGHESRITAKNDGTATSRNTRLQPGRFQRIELEVEILLVRRYRAYPLRSRVSLLTRGLLRSLG